MHAEDPVRHTLNHRAIERRYQEVAAQQTQATEEYNRRANTAAQMTVAQIKTLCTKFARWAYHYDVPQVRVRNGRFWEPRAMVWPFGNTIAISSWEAWDKELAEMRKYSASYNVNLYIDAHAQVYTHNSYCLEAYTLTASHHQMVVDTIVYYLEIYPNCTWPY